MKSRVLLLATAVVATGALFAASLATASPSGSTIHLTAKSNHKSFTVQIGDAIVVTLASNASTGYHWTRGATSAVKLASHRYVAPKHGMPGAPGKEVWHFKVVGPSGKGKIQLRYVSPSNMLAHRFAVSLSVG